MTIEADLRTALLAIPAVTAIVGTGATSRIYPGEFDEAVSHGSGSLLIEVDEERPANSLDGEGGLVFATVTITARASTMALARTLSEAVRTGATNPGTGLAGYAGASFDAVLDATDFATVPYDDGSGRAWCDVIQTYTCIFTETT